MDLSPEAWGLIGVALTGVIAWWGRRVESAGSRAIASQGAAAQQWQQMAAFERERAEKADAKVETLQEEVEELKAEVDVLESAARDREDVVADLRRQVAGLENRLVEVGEDVRVPEEVTG